MHDALAGLVIGVGEEDVPVGGKALGVQGKAMILTGDETTLCPLMNARLVVATVTIPGN